MANLTSTFLPRLKNSSFPGLDHSDRFILPKYEDQSILNIPPTICEWLGVPQFGEQTLDQEIVSTFDSGIRKVILVLIDGLSYHRLLRWLEQARVWKPLIESGILAPLTSVVPSTTCSSLTTLWTGRSPASHGIIGYEMWLKDYALVANMILHSPITFKDATPGSLKKAGFSPQHFLGLPTLGSHLRDNSVRSYAFSHYSITNSGLSQMLLKDVEILPFQTPASLWVSIRLLLETRATDKMYIWAYWGQLDSISHHYGPDDERAAAEFSHFSAAFEHFFLSPLDTRALQDTLVILISDHGQTYTPLDSRNLIKHHPQLNQYLRLNPTCENRFASLYLRPGTEDLVREYFKSRFPDRFTLISQEEALQGDLFGPGLRHPDLIHRLGDLIAIANEDAYLWWSDQEDFLLGRHGSLHPDDMIVPFLAARL